MFSRWTRSLTAHCRSRRCRSTLLSVALLGLCCTSVEAQKYGEVDRVAPTASAPTGQVLEWTSSEGKNYWYRLPRKIDRKNPPNLIFMLHGTGLTYGWAFWNYPIKSGAFRGNDIVIAPEGMTPGGGDTFNFVQNKKDGDQIAGLIRQFKSQFPVDKVYVYGHSQGAFFCYWFAGAYTELVDGIVAHAGNVLDVSHNKLAKEKVAIGILHGKADAVVSVECAYRTEKIYKQQGYKKLKMMIVEGLNEQSGHWPLPKEVAEMFDWLDQVNADSPQLALSVALSELGKDDPDLGVISKSVDKSRSLIKRVKGDEKKSLEAKLDRVTQFLAAVEAAHVEAILSGEESSKGGEKGAFHSWMAHFRHVHPSFAGSSSWKKALKSHASKARKQERTINAAVNVISAKLNRKSLRQAIGVFRKSMLAPNSGELARALGRLGDEPPPGTQRADFTEFRQLVAQRGPHVEAGVAAAAAITSAQARQFREAHPDLFAE